MLMIADGVVRGAIVVQSSRPGDLPARACGRPVAVPIVAQHILIALVRHQAHVELEHRVEERTRALTDEVRERQHGERLQAALYGSPTSPAANWAWRTCCGAST
ncbi:hypothetical protein [Thermomonas sp.]|uniref:hypothetical protein n=1 Tax=Thermomonas sp. TaxID=1971895 RepID=UPI001ED28B8A|nr:hypothetical protein [Thermomonas sp.]MBK6417569.1 hypothetical protein [Thermomonas sp.]